MKTYFYSTYKLRIIAVLMLVSFFLIPQKAQAAAPKGLFSINESTVVEIAPTNCTNGEIEHFQWNKIDSINTANTPWRVLSDAEWTYLLVTRDNGRAAPDYRNGMGIVAGVNGLIILPDNWVQPSGVPVFRYTADYTDIVYTAEQWNVMTNAGAVFLPCRGSHEKGEAIVDPDTHGAYWASTKKDTDTDKGYYCIRFNNGVIHDKNTAATATMYYSVRLVREVLVLDESDNQETFETKLASAKTEDYAIMRRTLHKNGYFNTLCLPFSVPDIATSPLAGAEIYTYESNAVTTAGDSLYMTITKHTGSTLDVDIPYLIRWTSAGNDLSFLVFEGLNVSGWTEGAAGYVSSENVKFQGVFGKTQVSDTDNPVQYNFFLGEANQFVWPATEPATQTTVNGFSAYFTLTPDESRQRGLPIGLKIKGKTPTDVETLYVSPAKATKMFREGKVVLVLDGETYSLDGRKL